MYERCHCDIPRPSPPRRGTGAQRRTLPRMSAHCIRQCNRTSSVLFSSTTHDCAKATRIDASNLRQRKAGSVSKHGRGQGGRGGGLAMALSYSPRSRRLSDIAELKINGP